MRIAIALIAPIAVVAAAPAYATGMNSNLFSVQVAHDDLDLTTQKGVSVLDDRIKTIIRRQCASNARDTESLRLERECRASAFASAQGQVRMAVAQANADKVRLASTKPVAPEA